MKNILLDIKFIKRAILIAAFILLPACAAFAQSPFISSTPGTANWTVPYGVTSITVETWGAGGAGGGSTGTGAGGGGGGGGYNTTTISGLTYGTIFSYTVGAGSAGTTGTGTAGGSTSFNSGTIATGGNGGVGGGAATYGAGGTGGTATSSGGGGGGGSAGNGSNGGNGAVTTGGTAGTAGSGTAGAAGGAGSTNSNGTGGTIPGSGGGGGKGSGKLGGAGANGQIKITYTQTCTAPPSQPTSLILTSAATTSIAGSFTAASYTDGYLVVRTTSSSSPGSPVNGTTYSAGGAMGTGTVVSAGATTSFTASTLTAHQQYWFWVYGYNNSPCTGGVTYLTTSPLSANGYTLCTAPSAQATSLTFPTVTYNSISASYTPSATADGYLVIEMTSNATVTAPTTGTVYTVGTSALGGTVVQAGAGTTFTSSGLSANTQYWYTVFAMTFTTCYGPVYRTATPLKSSTTTLLAPCVAPSAQATSLVLTGASTTSVGGSFTAEPSAYGYLVVRTTTSSQPTNPVDGTTYTAGQSVLGGLIIYAGTSTSFTSSSLTANTPYWYWVYDYNDVTCSSGPKYYTTSPLSGVGYTACVAPAAQPTVLNLTPTATTIAGSFTPAAGADGYLVIRMTSNTNPTNPTNGTVYTVGSSALGGYVEMAGAGTSFTSTGLPNTTQYWYTIFAYNFNTCLTVAYKTASPLKANATTLLSSCSAPTAQPTSFVFGTVYSESLSGSWTAASPAADGYLVVRTTTSSAPSSPVDGTTYTAGTSALGGLIAYAGTATSFSSPTPLTPSTQYWYWVYSYTANGSCSGIAYKTASPLSATTTTAAVGTYTNTATITTAGTATYNYSALSWSLGHLPTSSENAEIVLNVSTGTSDVVSIALDTSCTVYSYKMRNISSSPYVKILQTNGSVKYQVTTDMTMSCTGGNKFDRSVFANEDTTIINGNVILGSTTPGTTEGHSAIGSTAGNPNQTYILYGDMTFNKKGYTTDEHAVFIFDKAGTQHIYNNTTVTDTVAPVLFEMLYVGLTHATNLVFGGTTHDAYIENVRAGGIVVGANSTLDLPADYSIGKFSGGFAETFTLGAGARLRLGGYRGLDLNNNVVGISGSNFPFNFNTYSLDPTSTIEYYCDNSGTQTIYSGVTYPYLEIKNGAGTGRAQKITTGAITVNAAMNIYALADLTLGSTVSSAGPLNVQANGGLYCAANVVSGAGAFTLYSTGYLGMGHAQGITSGSTLTGNIQMTGGRSFSTGGNYIYNGSVTQITGTGLPSTCNELTIDNPTTVTIAANTTATGLTYMKQGTFDIGTTHFAINGSGTLNSITGKMKANVGVLEMSGSSGSAQSLDGSWFINKNISTLINGNTTGITLAATANDTLLISSALLWGGSTTNSTITTNNNLTLLSRDSSTARFGEIVTGSGNAITGNVNVEKYVRTNRKWRLLAWNTTSTQTARQAWMDGNSSANGNNTPGYGTIITDTTANWAASGFDSKSVSGPSVKYYDPTTNRYVGISNTTSYQMNSQSAYYNFVRGDRACIPANSSVAPTILRSTGTLKTGNQAFNVTAGKYAAIGNPYASAVDLRRLDTTGLTTAFYIWDPLLSGIYGLGAYQTIYKSGANYLVLPGGGSYGPVNSGADTVESGQAFFVKARATGTGTLTFKESAKNIGLRTQNRNVDVLESQVITLLSLHDPGSNTLVDGTIASFDPAYNNAVDDDDITKMLNTGESLGLMRNGTLLAIEERHSITTDDTLFLNISGERAHDYQFDITLQNMDNAGRTAFLIDRYLNTTTPLNFASVNSQVFTVVNLPGSYAQNRFIIVLRQPAVVPVRFTTISAARNTDKTVTVAWKAENEINLQDYRVERSTDGATFTETGTQLPQANNGGSASYSFIDTHPSDGINYYRVKANSLNGQKQYTAIVKVGPVSAENVFSIYPNPVEGGIINLHFDNQLKGKYTVSISNVSGQEIHTETVQADNDHFVRMISIGNYAAPGSYNARIIDEAGKATTINFIIK